MVRRTAEAGIAYFGVIFLLGSGLGTARILLLEPRLGAVAGTLIELPLMLGASWLFCGWVVSWLRVPADTASRLMMGGIALALLMAAELGLSMFAMGGSVANHFRAYRDPAPMLGLAGQVFFAGFPLLRGRMRRSQ